ncbi:MAG: hypothetical protein ACYDED_14190 [Ferrimicrobium sp.]
MTLENQGNTTSIAGVLEELSTHARMTVALTSDEGLIHHIRVSSTPEPNQRRIYDQCNIKDPLKRRRSIVAQL